MTTPSPAAAPLTGQLVVKADPTIEIFGTVDLIPACGVIWSAWIEDGELRVEYAGDSKVFWDGQTTTTRRGFLAFQDRIGDEYGADELALRLDDGTLLDIPGEPGARVILGDEPEPIFDSRELATVLAALRHWQATPSEQVKAGVLEIATCGDEFPALDDSEIDALCERINA